MIYLVRHGETTLNQQGVRHGRDDCDLTVNGAAQAWSAGLEVAEFGEAVVITSPLKRARHTARIIAMCAGLAEPRTYIDLTERPFFNGVWLETCEEAGARVRRVLSDFAGFAPNLIVVSHAGPLKGLLNFTRTPANGSVHRWHR